MGVLVSVQMKEFPVCQVLTVMMKCSILPSLPSTAAPCPPGKFRCAAGGCKEPSHECDGIRHCQDYSDEENCGKYILQVLLRVHSL